MDILVSMFCLGVFSLVGQVLFMREMLVVFLGNELIIGVLLSCWLLEIGLGAWLGGAVARKIHSQDAGRTWLAVLQALAGLSLPFQLLAIRTVRSWLSVPVGEYAPLHAVAVGAALIFPPTCLSIGCFFPIACGLLAKAGARAGEEAARAVGAVYTIEASGSMLAGAVCTYVLLPFLSPLRIVLPAVAVALCGSAAAAPRRIWRGCLVAAGAAIILLSLARPGSLHRAEQAFVEARWRAFGVLADRGGDQAVRLVHWDNTVYQNLALFESAGQYSLYGNGQVMFVFPDPISYEHDVHFAMAQNPGARRVLLLGGNPVGQIPELLKYPLTRLVYVDIDPGIGRIVGKALPNTLESVQADPRVLFVPDDPARFVRRCRRTFDAILVHAPEPTTAAANRFYTFEFFEQLKRLLSRHGFVSTAVSSSERLQSEAAELGATVYRTLTAVFPVVLVTAETRNRFFAGKAALPGAESGGQTVQATHPGLTFERKVLYERSRKSGIETHYFRPEYFLAADEIDPSKTALARRRFTAANVPLNSSVKPVSFFYNLFLWGRYSGSGFNAFLARLKDITAASLAKSALAAGLICLLGGRLARRSRGRWMRLMVGLVIASTGFCGMALEIVLIFAFQSLYGYVYTRIGFIVAMFMLGLVLGAPSGRLMARGGRRKAWLSIGGLELFLAFFALALPAVVRCAAASKGLVLDRLEPAFFLMVAMVGWAVGAEFPLGNRLLAESGARVGAAAAVTDASDHIGAAVGALIAGVVLVPVLGTSGACTVLASLKIAGVLLLGSAVVTGR